MAPEALLRLQDQLHRLLPEDRQALAVPLHQLIQLPPVDQPAKHLLAKHLMPLDQIKYSLMY